MTQPEHGAVYDALPVFDNHHGRPEVWRGLRVEGMVERPTVFSAADLVELTRQTIVDDFRCVEGWSAPGQEWEGVPLAVLLDMVKPLPTARFALRAGRGGGFPPVGALPSGEASGIATPASSGSCCWPPDSGWRGTAARTFAGGQCQV